jgi:hypothetical protein
MILDFFKSIMGIFPNKIAKQHLKVNRELIDLTIAAVIGSIQNGGIT